MHTRSKCFLLLGAVLAASCAPLSAQDDAAGEAGKLPKNAAEVLGKMEQFETQTLLEAQVKIEKKRADVVRYLEKLMDEETRSGNLDGALAIRKEVGRLKALPSARPEVSKKVAPAGAEVVAKEEPEEGEPHAVVGRWTFKDQYGAAMVREFTAEGKCVQYRAGRKEWSLDYEVVNAREVDVVFLGALKFRHKVRGNDTLEIKEPDGIAEREKPEKPEEK